MDSPPAAAARAGAITRLSAGVARGTQRLPRSQSASAALSCGTDSIVKPAFAKSIGGQATDVIHRSHSLLAPGRPSSENAFPSSPCGLRRTSLPRPRKTRARGTPGPQQPRSSVHDVSSWCTDIVTTKLPDPRRSARGVYRFAPLDPRWTDTFRRPLALG